MRPSLFSVSHLSLLSRQMVVLENFNHKHFIKTKIRKVLRLLLYGEFTACYTVATL